MELYMVCVLMAIALAMLIFKGVQLVLSLVHPLPNEADIKWRQNPQLPLEQFKKKDKKENKKKPKEPKGRRPPRNIRLEQIYSGSPTSFDELDASFGRRSMSSNNKIRIPSRYDEYSQGHDNMQQGHIPLEQISFVEDEEDPIEVYVQQQHQRMLLESGHHSNRSSTPIQSYSPRAGPNPKSHATIV